MVWDSATKPVTAACIGLLWEPSGYGELIKEATALAMYVTRHGVATLTLIRGWDPCIESELDFLPLATSGDNRLRLDGTPFILPRERALESWAAR